MKKIRQTNKNRLKPLGTFRIPTPSPTEFHKDKKVYTRKKKHPKRTP